METNTTTAHPFLMADDCYRTGDVADTFFQKGIQTMKVWSVAQRHKRFVDNDWLISGSCYYSSKEAALRSTSRMIRSNPEIWVDVEFLPIEVIWCRF